MRSYLALCRVCALQRCGCLCAQTCASLWIITGWTHGLAHMGFERGCCGSHDGALLQAAARACTFTHMLLHIDMDAPG